MESTALWTGRFEFDLRSGYGWSVATVDVSVRLDIVLMFIGNRTIAAIDRDQLRAWLRQPYENFTIDDIAFVRLGDDICFTIDQSPPYSLSLETMGQFVKRI